MRKISYYHEDLGTAGINGDDVYSLVELHTKSFAEYGWEVIHLTEDASRKHPAYERFTNPDSIIGKSKNPWAYTRACYMRWLAYAVEGLPFCDFDVMNYGFTPEMADDMLVAAGGGDDPIIISLAGAAGLVTDTGYSKIVDCFLEFIDSPVVEGHLLDDINDMTILRQFRPEWFTRIPYVDQNYVKDYTLPSWESARLVHFPYHYTPVPRVKTVMSARPV